jgi:serine/threonine protein kinase
VKLGTSETSKNENKLGFPITALREINILLSLSHPNIVAVKEMVVGSAMNQVFMVMDFSENDIKSCIELSKPNLPFSTGEVKCLMQQLLSGVEYLHSKWYLHRDLKTSNLLYSNLFINANQFSHFDIIIIQEDAKNLTRFITQ